MATTESLGPSITQLSYPQACELVKASRLRRRTQVQKPKALVVRTEAKQKRQVNQKNAIGKLTPEQAKALLKALAQSLS